MTKEEKKKKQKVRPHCYACGQRSYKLREIEGKQVCINCQPEKQPEAVVSGESAFEQDDGEEQA